jgi:hypothetical protein
MYMFNIKQYGNIYSLLASHIDIDKIKLCRNVFGPVFPSKCLPEMLVQLKSVCEAAQSVGSAGINYGQAVVNGGSTSYNCYGAMQESMMSDGGCDPFGYGGE